MDFNATEDKMVIDMPSVSRLQLSFKTLPCAEFWVVSKKNFHSYLKKLLKFFFLFQLLCETGFSSHTSTNISNRLSAETGMRI